MKPRFGPVIVLVLAAGLPAPGAWYVNTPAGFQRAFGGPARLGPYPTRAYAIQVWNANFKGPPNIDGYDDVDPAEAEREAQRIADERKAREAAEEQRKQREFDDARKNASDLLKGVVSPDNTLKPVGPTVRDDRLRVLGDAGGVGDTQIKDVRPDRYTRDLAGRQAAWKQLNGASYLAKQAAAKGNADEALYLAEQAIRAANGDPLGVALPAAPPMPTWSEDKLATPEYHAAAGVLKRRLKKQLSALVEHETRQKQRIATLRQAEADLKSAEDKLAALPPATGSAPPASDRGRATAAQAAAASAKEAAQRAVEQGQIEALHANSKINETARSTVDLERDPDLARTILTEIEDDSATESLLPPATGGK